MPVLIIVISAYLFFFAVIALIAVAEFADRRERSRRPIMRARVSLATTLLTDTSDAIFAVLWDAQIPALRPLNDQFAKISRDTMILEERLNRRPR